MLRAIGVSLLTIISFIAIGWENKSSGGWGTGGYCGPSYRPFGTCSDLFHPPCPPVLGHYKMVTVYEECQVPYIIPGHRHGCHWHGPTTGYRIVKVPVTRLVWCGPDGLPASPPAGLGPGGGTLDPAIPGGNAPPATNAVPGNSAAPVNSAIPGANVSAPTVANRVVGGFASTASLDGFGSTGTTAGITRVGAGASVPATGSNGTANAFAGGTNGTTNAIAGGTNGTPNFLRSGQAAGTSSTRQPAGIGRSGNIGLSTGTSGTTVPQFSAGGITGANAGASLQNRGFQRFRSR
jgi:hypothetical protein